MGTEGVIPVVLGDVVGIRVVELDEDAGVVDDAAGVVMIGTVIDQGRSVLSCFVSRSMRGSVMGESGTGILSCRLGEAIGESASTFASSAEMILLSSAVRSGVSSGL